MSDEISYTHQTIPDPNGSTNYVLGVLVITGLITLPLVALGSVYLLVRWLFAGN